MTAYAARKVVERQLIQSRELGPQLRTVRQRLPDYEATVPDRVARALVPFPWDFGPQGVPRSGDDAYLASSRGSDAAVAHHLYARLRPVVDGAITVLEGFGYRKPLGFNVGPDDISLEVRSRFCEAALVSRRCRAENALRLDEAVAEAGRLTG